MILKAFFLKCQCHIQILLNISLEYYIKHIAVLHCSGIVSVCQQIFQCFMFDLWVCATEGEKKVNVTYSFLTKKTFIFCSATEMW